MSMNPYESANPDYVWQATLVERRHSGLGIASFAFSILVGILMLCLFAMAGFLAATAGDDFKEDSKEAIAIGLAGFGIMFLDFVAFALGIAGLFQPNRQKMFAILGAIFSFGVAAATIGLVALGLSTKK
jgi:hypothetical protein